METEQVTMGFSKCGAILVLVLHASLTAGLCPNDSPDPVVPFEIIADINTSPGTAVPLSTTGGGGTCILAMLIYNNTVQETHHDSFGELALPVVSFDSFGTCSIILYISNNVSSSSHSVTISVDDELVGFPDTVIQASLWDEVNWLLFGLTSGSRFTIYVDWGDDIVEQRYFESILDAETFGHIYEFPGVHIADVSIFNTWGFETMKITTYSEFLVQLLTVTAPRYVLYPPGEFDVSVTADDSVPLPNHVNCSIMKNNVSEVTTASVEFSSENLTSNITASMEPGWHSITLNCLNHISAQSDLTLDLEVVIPVEGVHLAINDLVAASYIPTNIAKDFIISVTGGTNVTAQVDFGDGTTSDVIPFTDLKASLGNVTFSKIYSSLGNCTVKAICLNSVSEKFALFNIEVLVPLIGLDILSAPLSLPLVTYTLTMMAHETPGPDPMDSVHCTFNYWDGISEKHYIDTNIGGVTTGTGVVTMADPSVFDFTHNFGSYTYGNTSASVFCTNRVSNLTAEVVVEIRQPILNLSASSAPLPYATEINSVTDISVTILQGTNVTVHVTCDSAGAPMVVESYVIPEGELSVTAFCNYTAVGNYSVSINADNIVSTADIMIEIIVQERIADIEFSSNSPQANPPGELEFYITLEDPKPTDVFISFDFNGDGLNDTLSIYTPQIITTNSITHSVTLPPDYLGNYNCSVFINNLISNQTRYTAMILQKYIINPQIRTESFYVRAGISTDIFITVLNGSHITYTVDFGDGAIRSFTPDAAVQDGVLFQTNHTFFYKGEHVLSGNASNLLGAVLFPNHKIFSRWPLVEEDIEFGISDYVKVPTGRGVFSFDLIDLHNIPDDVIAEVHLPTRGFVYYVTAWPFSVDVDFDNSLGEVQAAVLLNNNVSAIWFNKTFYLEEEIKGAFITGERYVQQFSISTYVFKVKTGTAVNITIETYEHSSIQKIGSNASIPFSFTSTGVTNITALFYNHVCNMSAFYEVIVQPQVKFKLISNAPVPFPQRLNWTFQLMAPSEEGLFNFDVSYEDATGFTEEDVYVVGAHTLQRSFTIFGDYMMTVNISNNVSFQLHSASIHVDVPPSGPNFTVFSWLNDTDEDLGIVFEPSVPVFFTGSVVTGSRVNYTYTITGYKTLSGRVSDNTFLDDGPYSVTMTAYNHVSSVNISQTVWVASPVGLVVYNQPEEVYLVDVLHIELTFDFPKNLCLHFVYDGPSLVEMWHETLPGMCARKGYTSDAQINLLPWGRVFQLSVKFDVSGKYIETLWIYTENRMQKKTFDLNVQRHACKKPIIRIPNLPGLSKGNPKMVKKSENLVVSTEDTIAALDCRETSEFFTKWDIFKLDANTGSTNDMGVPLDIPGIRKRKLFLQAEKTSLEYGLYRVQLGVLMKKYTFFNTSESLFVKINPTPLIAHIESGAFKIVGDVNPIHVTALAKSRDPDDPGSNLTPLIYTWFCHRKDENFDIDIKSHFSTWTPTVVVPDIDDQIYHGVDLGGCFKTGAGRLQVTAGAFTIYPQHIIPGIYVLTLRVEKGIRRTITKQELTIVHGNPVTLHIGMVTPPHCPGLFSPDTDIHFYGSCKECGPSMIPDFSWRLLDLDKEVPSAEYWSEELESGGIAPTLTLEKPPLKYGEKYVLELKAAVDSGEYDNGREHVELITSSPPLAGYCELLPKGTEVVFMKTPVQINCLDWMNVDNEPINEIKTTIRATVAGVTSDVPSPLAYLPLGDPMDDFKVLLTIAVTEPCGSIHREEKLVRVVPEGHEPGMSEDALFMLLIYAIRDAANGLDHEGVKLAPSNAASLIMAATASVDLKDPRATEAQNALVTLLAALTLGGDTYTLESSVVLSQALDSLASTITPGMEDDKLDILYDILDRQADALLEIDSFELLDKIASALTGVAVSLINHRAEIKEIQASVEIKENDIPTKFEDSPPEIQEEILKQKKEKIRSHIKPLIKVGENLGSASIRTLVSKHRGISLGNDDYRVRGSITKKSMFNHTEIHTSFCATVLQEVEPLPCDSERVFFVTSYVKKNFIDGEETGSDINGPMSGLKMYAEQCHDGDGREDRMKRQADDGIQQVDYKGRFFVGLDVSSMGFPEVNMTEAPVDVNTSMIYFFVPIQDDDIGLIIDFEPINAIYKKERLMVYSIFKAKESILYKPKQTWYDQADVLPREGFPNPWTIVIGEDVPKVPGAYIGLLVVEPNLAEESLQSEMVNGVNMSIVPADMIVTNGTAFPFLVHSSFTSCRNWNTEKREWQNSTCKLSNLTTKVLTKCECTEATKVINTMSTAFKPPSINTIDFRNVLGNFAVLLQGNPAVFATIITVTVIYILLLLWTRRADRSDKIKWGIYPLLDNVQGHNYRYQINILTGVRQKSGTKSNVSLIISGEDNDTGIRILEGGPLKGFGRGTVRRFLMTTNQALGQLNHVHIWHDNSGGGDNSGWFLDKILVEDLQTDDKFHFLCNQWLSVDEADGNIERIIPIAGKEQILDPTHLFASTSRKNIADEHLWISVFARPERSKFTRVERLTCGASFLFITMITDAMWFKSDSSAQNDRSLRIGPIILSAATLYVSLLATLFSVPISTVIVIFFQKSRPKPLKPDDSPTGYEPPRAFYKAKVDRTAEERLLVKKYWRQFPLPHWCTYIAWTLAILSIFLSAFFVILYSLEWGRTKAEEWLSAFFLSFFQNVFLVQPFKVVIVALAVACIFKKIDEQDEKIIKKSAPEEDQNRESNRPVTPIAAHGPLSKEALKRAQYTGMREKLAKRTIKEICLYIIFLILIMYLGWGTRTSADYNIKRSVLAMLKPAANRHMSIEKVTDGTAMWKWIRETLIPNMYWQKYYNGAPTSRLLRNYINDFSSVRMGTVRLRQLRCVPELCPPGIPHQVCRPGYDLLSQEDRDFTAKWSKLLNSSDKPHRSRIDEAFTFKSFLKLQNIPYLGVVGIYGGGGYVAELGNNSASALYLINQLVELDWVDKGTRAVFFETTIYNANAHVFASLNCLFEFPPTGGVLPRINVDTFHAYANVGNKGTVTMALMVVFVLFLIYLIVHEALKIKEDSKRYFKDPWNKLEVVFLALAFTCVGMYGSKEVYSRYITEKISEEKDAHLGYMQLSVYEIGYNAMVGMVTFIATVKCLRLLNFSANVRELSRSLKLIRNELLSFSIIFLVIYVGFATIGYQIFGRNVYDYSSFVRSLESLFAALLAKYDYPGMVGSNPIMAQLFLFLYSVTIMFVLINIFIGLLTACFQEARLDVAEHLEEDVWIYILYKIKVFLRLTRVEVEDIKENDAHEIQNEEDIDIETIRRQQLRSLRVHLHFLDQYVKTVVDKEHNFPDFCNFDKVSGKKQILNNTTNQNQKQTSEPDYEDGDDEEVEKEQAIWSPDVEIEEEEEVFDESESRFCL